MLYTLAYVYVICVCISRGSYWVLVSVYNMCLPGLVRNMIVISYHWPA